MALVGTKDSYIRFRCSNREKEQIEKNASEMQMTVTDYLVYLVHQDTFRREMQNKKEDA